MCSSARLNQIGRNKAKRHCLYTLINKNETPTLLTYGPMRILQDLGARVRCKEDLFGWQSLYVKGPTPAYSSVRTNFATF